MKQGLLPGFTEPPRPRRQHSAPPRPIPAPARQRHGRRGPPCFRCGGPTVQTGGNGPHYARADCNRCHAWRWLPWPRDGKGGGP
jgi:hypothetical protein